MIAEEDATLFEHCARTLDLSLPVGENGLPLFGGGDWNDGMNRVGEGDGVGLTSADARMPLLDDGATHRVCASLG